jgi:glycosyltransferase involved in cell wall biosynthesis|tara:strand:+ start:2145 stop:3323 length:1179 start_codon:yes stop_codon:yes gene_type:complete
MKILHIISSLIKDDGGLPEIVKNLAHQQNNSQVVSHIATTQSKLKKLTLDSHLKGLKVFVFEREIFNSIQFSYGFKKFMDNNIDKYDLIHIHGLYRFPTSYAAFKAKRNQIPYIISTHGALDPYLYNTSNKNLFLKRLWEYLFDFPNFRNSNAIHCTSEVEKKKVRQLNLNKNIFVIPIFISNTFLKKKLKKNSFNKSIGLNKKNFIILFLGRINFKKGLDLLIPAFKKIHDEFPLSRLLMVGGNSEGYLQKTINPLIKKHNIRKQVLYHKPIYGEKLINCYREADLFVLPSYSENFGLTIFEAMSQKTPVVVSNQVDLAPIIKKNNIARICKCTVNSIYLSIRLSILNKKQSKNLSKKAYKFVINNYTSDKVVNRINKKYKEIIKKNVQSD